MKKIFFDFETTCTDPVNTNLFQATFLVYDEKFGKYDLVEELNEFIKLNKSYDEFTVDEKKTLCDIHKIKNKEDLEKHEKKAIELDEFVNKFEAVINEAVNSENFKYCEFYGWNCSVFDNIIFMKYLSKTFDFPFKLIDIKDRYLLLKNKIRIINNKKLEKFVEEKGINPREKNGLKTSFEFMVGEDKELKFHNSKFDCIAVFELNKKFDELFLKLNRMNFKNKEIEKGE